MMRPVPASAGFTLFATSCTRKTGRVSQLETSPDRSECPAITRATSRHKKKHNTRTYVLSAATYKGLSYTSSCSFAGRRACTRNSQKDLALPLFRTSGDFTSGDLLMFSFFCQAGYEEVGVLLDNAEGRIEGWEAGDLAQEYATERSVSRWGFDTAYA